MTDGKAVERDVEHRISDLLRIGVLVSAALLAAGWAAAELEHPSAGAILDAGVRVLISTPIARVAATLVLFLRQRDRLYAVVTATVLALLAIGVVGGVQL